MKATVNNKTRKPTTGRCQGPENKTRHGLSSMEETKEHGLREGSGVGRSRLQCLPEPNWGLQLNWGKSPELLTGDDLKRRLTLILTQEHFFH